MPCWWARSIALCALCLSIWQWLSLSLSLSHCRILFSFFLSYIWLSLFFLPTFFSPFALMGVVLANLCWRICYLWVTHGRLRMNKWMCTRRSTATHARTHMQDKWDLYSHVSVLSRLFVLLKYWGFSITGILVMPMITASGPISEEDGVLLPLETWWRGEAESSSLLITDDGPKRAKRRERAGTAESIWFILSLMEKAHMWKSEAVTLLLTEMEDIILKWMGEVVRMLNISSTSEHSKMSNVDWQ